MTTVANDRIVFIHVPRTGGTWVSRALAAGGVEVERVMGKDRPHPRREILDLEGRFAFAFVREPLSWYQSMWAFHRRRPFTDWPAWIRWKIDFEFPVFLQYMVENHPGFLTGYYELFVGPPEDPIDYIGRYEHLADDVVTALRLAEQDFDETALRGLPAVNEAGLAAPDCPPELQARVRESEHRTYERFYSQ